MSDWTASRPIHGTGDPTKLDTCPVRTRPGGHQNHLGVCNHRGVFLISNMFGVSRVRRLQHLAAIFWTIYLKQISQYDATAGLS